MNRIDKISSVNYFCSWIIAGPGPQRPARSPPAVSAWQALSVSGWWWARAKAQQGNRRLPRRRVFRWRGFAVWCAACWLWGAVGCRSVLVRPTGWCSGRHLLAARGFGSALIRLQRWRACHLPGGWGRVCASGVMGLGVCHGAMLCPALAWRDAFAARSGHEWKW